MALPYSTDPLSNSRASSPIDNAARILARLAHRFADREAILWRSGLDEERWAALERSLLLELSSPTGGAEAMAHFAKAFAEARLELTRAAFATAEDQRTIQRPSELPPSIDESAVTRPRGAADSDLGERFRSTATLGTPNRLGALPEAVHVRAPELDDGSTVEDALSATLHSPGRAPDGTPRSP